jgi:glutaredoxin/glutathione-dependent peroxiredoxin
LGRLLQPSGRLYARLHHR